MNTVQIEFVDSAAKHDEQALRADGSKVATPHEAGQKVKNLEIARQLDHVQRSIMDVLQPHRHVHVANAIIVVPHAASATFTTEHVNGFETHLLTSLKSNWV